MIDALGSSFELSLVNNFILESHDCPRRTQFDKVIDENDRSGTIIFDFIALMIIRLFTTYLC